MTEIVNEEQLTTQGEELDDFDVEGHGLKEIALGLSAATIVAGGAGAAALAMDNPMPGTTSGARQTVAGAQQDVQDRTLWAERVAGDALTTADGTIERTLRSAERTVTFATTTVTTTTAPVLADVDALVDGTTEVAQRAVADTVDLAEQTVADPIGTTDRAVDAAMVTARDTMVTARATRDAAMATAGQTADTAVKTATTTAKEATDLATTTVGNVQEVLDPEADVQMDDGGATVHVGVAGASVTVSTG